MQRALVRIASPAPHLYFQGVYFPLLYCSKHEANMLTRTKDTAFLTELKETLSACALLKDPVYFIATVCYLEGSSNLRVYM